MGNVELPLPLIFPTPNRGDLFKYTLVVPKSASRPFSKMKYLFKAKLMNHDS